MEERWLDDRWRFFRWREGGRPRCTIVFNEESARLQITTDPSGGIIDSVHLILEHPDLAGRLPSGRIFVNGYTWELGAPKRFLINGMPSMDGVMFQVRTTIDGEFFRDLREGNNLSIDSATGRRLIFSLRGSLKALDEMIRVCRYFQ